MEQERAFLEAICAQPQDDAPRLAYANWLQERGDPRGDFIHDQVRWHQAILTLDVAAMNQYSRHSATQRQYEAWQAPLKELGLYGVQFRRGFVEAGTIELADFLANADRIFELAPLLHELYTSHKEPDWLLRLAEFPALRRLDAVKLLGAPVGGGAVSADALRAFASSPNAANLGCVELQQLRLTGTDIPAACVQLLGLPQLTRFAFIGNGVCARGPKQRRPPTPIGDEVVAALAQSPNLSRLRVLTIIFSQAVTDAAAAALAASPYLASLEGLELSQTAITDAGAQALADSPRLACLTRLDLCLSAVGNAGLEALIGSPNLGALRNLTLGAKVTDKGVRALAACPAASRLRCLDLSHNSQVCVGGAEALAASEHLANLQDLCLWETRIGPRGAMALIQSTRLPGLRLLRVDSGKPGWDPAIGEALKNRFG